MGQLPTKIGLKTAFIAGGETACRHHSYTASHSRCRSSVGQEKEPNQQLALAVFFDIPYVVPAATAQKPSERFRKAVKQTFTVSKKELARRELQYKEQRKIKSHHRHR